MKTTVMLDNNVMETLLTYTQATSSKEAIYQAIQEYISYKKRQELRDLEIHPCGGD